jgi:aspartate racemase
MKTLGLTGGTSWHSTVDYYRYINEAINDAYGAGTNPPLIFYNMNQEKIHKLQAKGQWDEPASLLTRASIRLHAGGGSSDLVLRQYTPQVLRSSFVCEW